MSPARGRPRRRRSTTDAGNWSQSPKRSHACCACAHVEESGTVRSVTVSSGSPTTSLTVRLRISQPHADPSLPPLIAERCLRTWLMLTMSAPLASSSRFVSTLSAREMPSAGTTASAELPPVTRAMTRSPGPARRATSSSRSPASRLDRPGTGCDASSTSTCRSCRAWPRFTTTAASVRRGPRSRSSTAAMPIVALPAPTRKTRRPARSTVVVVRSSRFVESGDRPAANGQPIAIERERAFECGDRVDRTQGGSRDRQRVGAQLAASVTDELVVVEEGLWVGRRGQAAGVRPRAPRALPRCDSSRAGTPAGRPAAGSRAPDRRRRRRATPRSAAAGCTWPCARRAPATRS